MSCWYQFFWGALCAPSIATRQSLPCKVKKNKQIQVFIKILLNNQSKAYSQDVVLDISGTGNLECNG